MLFHLIAVLPVPTWHHWQPQWSQTQRTHRFRVAAMLEMLHARKRSALPRFLVSLGTPSIKAVKTIQMWLTKIGVCDISIYIVYISSKYMAHFQKNSGKCFFFFFYWYVTNWVFKCDFSRRRPWALYAYLGPGLWVRLWVLWSHSNDRHDAHHREVFPVHVAGHGCGQGGHADWGHQYWQDRDCQGKILIYSVLEMMLL